MIYFAIHPDLQFSACLFNDLIVVMAIFFFFFCICLSLISYITDQCFHRDEFGSET